MYQENNARYLDSSMMSFVSVRQNPTSTIVTSARNAPTRFGSKYGYLKRRKGVGRPLRVVFNREPSGFSMMLSVICQLDANEKLTGVAWRLSRRNRAEILERWYI